MWNIELSFKMFDKMVEVKKQTLIEHVLNEQLKEWQEMERKR